MVHRRVKITGKQGVNKGIDKDIPEIPLINTTSSSKNWSKEFSPFFLTNIPIYNGIKAKNMENAWQFSKLYPEHADKEGNPTERYFKWAEKGWNSKYAERYPMGRKRPLCSIWDGKKLTYLEARKKIYIPLYAKAVVKTDAYKRLKTMYDSGEDFILWDVDGYDYLSLNMTYEEVANNERLKMGHAFVIGMLLEGLIIIENGKLSYNLNYLNNI